MNKAFAIVSFLFLIFNTQITFCQYIKVILTDARTYYDSSEYNKALEKYQEAISLNNEIYNKTTFYNAACCASLLNKDKLAIKYLKKSIDLGYYNVLHLKKDEDFKNIESSKKFKKLIKKLEQQNNKIIVKNLTFERTISEKNKYTIEQLKKAFANNFHLIGAGEPAKPKDESYANLIYDVFNALLLNERLAKRAVKVLFDRDAEMYNQMENTLKSPDLPLVCVFTLVLRELSGSQEKTQFFFISFIDNGKPVYEITLTVKSKIELIYSDIGSKLLKRKLYDELFEIIK